MPAAEVAPRAGAWIETFLGYQFREYGLVAPRAGAWIETCMARPPCTSCRVAPRAGAWIETDQGVDSWVLKLCRPPRGGVD